ncbi:MAG: type II toxin-antitoxin system HicA family toxin [Solobacterium sp.]|nr:type II toxin-antitoxin system HicA family toxin [Solobacterium sp.]
MKQKDLTKLLLQAGFVFYGHGANHDRYKRGDVIEQIPRHKEINEQLAKAILKRNGISR